MVPMPVATPPTKTAHTRESQSVQKAPRLRWWECVALGVVLIAGMTAALLSMRSELDIIDERPHIASGYAMAWYGDARWNIEHPPLLKMLSGFTARVAASAFPEHRLQTWEGYGKFQQWNVGDEWFAAEGENLLDLLWWARLPNVVMMYGGACVLIWWWGRSLFGREAGLCALLLMACSPTILAHSRYVTTDLAATAGALLGAWALWMWVQRPGSRRAWLVGVAFGVALLGKYSLVLLVPLSLVTMGIAWITTWRRGAVRDADDARSIVWLAGQWLLMWSVACVVVLAGAWFATRSMGADDIARTIEAELHALENGAPFLFVADWVRSVPVLSPLGWFVVGLGSASGRALGGGGSVIFGMTLAHPVWWYFPGMWMFKSTVPVLMSCLGSLLWIAWKGPKRVWAWCKRVPAVPYIGLCATVFMGAGMVSELNLGIRHVLPAFPFVFLLLGYALSRLWNASVRSTAWKIAARGVVVGLVGWHVGAAVWAFPGYLSYANALFGHNDAWRYTNDSNLDWGQEVLRMIQYVQAQKEQEGIEELFLVTYGVWQPTAYQAATDLTITGVSSPGALPEHGFVAISGSCYIPDYPTCLPEQGDASTASTSMEDPLLWKDVLSQDQLVYVSEGAMLLFSLETTE